MMDNPILVDNFRDMYILFALVRKVDIDVVVIWC